MGAGLGVNTTGVNRLESMTTTERDALEKVNGMIIYNSSDNKVQVVENGSWANVI